MDTQARSDLLRSYKVGVTTEQNFLKEWSAGAVFLCRMGILGMTFEGERAQYIVGLFAMPDCLPDSSTADDFQINFENQVHARSQGMWKADSTPRFSDAKGNDITTNQCKLRFRSGILEAIEWLESSPVELSAPGVKRR